MVGIPFNNLEQIFTDKKINLELRVKILKNYV